MNNRIVRFDECKDSSEKSERGCLRYIFKSIVAIVGLHLTMSVFADTYTFTIVTRISYPTGGGGGGSAVAPPHEIRTEVVDGVEWTYMTGFPYIERNSYAQETTYANWVSMNPDGASGLIAVPGYWGVYIGDGTNAAVSASISGHVNVPRVLGECRVIGISANAFSNCTAITSISVPEEVIKIRMGAFTGCSGITEMALPFVGSERGNSSGYDYWTSDGRNGNETECNFGWIFGTTPYNGGAMTSQGFYWYSSDSRSYCIPSALSTVSITDETILSCAAFQNMTTLTHIDLPATLREIRHGAFGSCTGLPDIVVPNGVRLIEGGAFGNCYSLTNAIIPGTVSTIKDEVFANSGIRSVPRMLPRIPDGAFKNCRYLTEAFLDDWAIDIGNDAFNGCASLTNVVVGSSVTNIGAWAFHECIALESISVPGSVKSIGSSAFNGCTNLFNVSLSEGLEILGNGTFRGCTALQEIDLPDSVVDLGREDPYRVLGNVFRGCTSLRSVKLPTLLKFLPDNTFWGCNSLADIELPSGVESIGSYAFCNCDALEELTLPPAVTNIASGAFSYCKALKGVVAQGTIKTLGSTAFYYCSNLKKIEMHGNAPTVVDWMPFMGVPGSCCVYVPVTSTGWGVNIPGAWNGVRIDYLPFDVPTDENVVIAPQEGQNFTADDVVRFVGKATPGKGREGQSAAYFKAVGRIAEDGAVVIESAIDEEAVELPMTTKEVLDASLSTVDMTADAPSVTLPAESVKEGFYYGVAAAGSLDALNGLSPALSRASGGALQVNVAKPADESAGPTKTAAFFKVVVSDKQ